MIRLLTKNFLTEKKNYYSSLIKLTRFLIDLTNYFGVLNLNLKMTSKKVDESSLS